MDWTSQAKNKVNQGIDQLTKESDCFIKLLNNFNDRVGLQTTDPLIHANLLPEGGMWLVRLKDRSEILVEKCSYEVENDDVDYVWVDFEIDPLVVKVEINKKNGSMERHTLLEGEILEFYP